MFKKIKIIVNIFLIINLFNFAQAKENFFEKAKKMFNEKKLEDSKFLFQRNIVFNPKHARSYLYLAKIYNLEEDERKEEKNLNATLLLEPDNEEAMYMLINIELKKSNYSKVKDLNESFAVIWKELCEKKKEMEESIKNIAPNDES